MMCPFRELLTILVKHAFGNNTDLFMITRTSEKSHVLHVRSSISVEFSLQEYILKQPYHTDILMETKKQSGFRLIASAIKSSKLIMLLQFG